MVWLFLILFVEILIGSLLPTGVDPVALQYTLVMINVLFVCWFIIMKGGRYKMYLFVGFLVRFFLFICDCNDFFPILHSGADTEVFHYKAVQAAFYNADIKTFQNYHYFLTFVYQLAGYPARILCQYINVLFGLGVMVAIKNLLDLLSSPPRTARISMLLVCFFPHFIIFSGILLREAWIEYAIALSAFYFAKWALSWKQKYFFLSILCVMAGSAMHAGVLFVVIGYIAAYLFLQKKTYRSRFSFISIVSLVILGAVGLVFASYSELFMGKFQNVENVDDMVDMANFVSSGGSAYLSWLQTQSFGRMILFSPLVLFYFLFSPLPLDWRGVSDIVAFLFDSLIYFVMLICLYKLIFKKRVAGYYQSVSKYIMLGVLCSALVFSFGTRASGTAIRHRAKLFPLFIAAYVVIGSRPRKGVVRLNFRNMPERNKA